MPLRKRRPQNNFQETKPTPRPNSSSLRPILVLKIVSFLCLISISLVLYNSFQTNWFSRATNVESTQVGSVDDREAIARDASIFSVQQLPGKGMGVVAVRDIKQGELVIRERPLFVLPAQVSTSPTAFIIQHLKQLSPHQYSQFYNLSYVHFPSNLDPKIHLPELALAIFETNAVSAGPGEIGIFPRMARLNHGCSSAFNVVYTWRENEGVLVVHTLKDIKKGQELLTTYTDTKRPRDQRRTYLDHQYAFHCTCEVCSLPDVQSLESDRRLTAMSELYAQFATWGTQAIEGDEAITIVKRIWDLGSEEGYWSERGRLAADAAWVAAAHADAAGTKAWAKVAEEWYGYEVGVDSEQAQEMHTLQIRPENHPAWSSRRPIGVSGPT